MVGRSLGRSILIVTAHHSIFDPPPNKSFFDMKNSTSVNRDQETFIPQPTASILNIYLIFFPYIRTPATPPLLLFLPDLLLLRLLFKCVRWDLI